MGWGGWLLMGGTTIVFWVLLALAGVAVWRAVGRGNRTADQRAAGHPTADDVLDQRFARGEIDEDEYRRRRELLHSGRPTAP